MFKQIYFHTTFSRSLFINFNRIWKITTHIKKYTSWHTIGAPYINKYIIVLTGKISLISWWCCYLSKRRCVDVVQTGGRENEKQWNIWKTVFTQMPLQIINEVIKKWANKEDMFQPQRRYSIETIPTLSMRGNQTTPFINGLQTGDEELFVFTLLYTRENKHKIH